MPPAGDALAARVAAVMEAHWRPALRGTVPHAEVYPWLWLWDSCFHALVWDALGDERAAQELAGVFATQDPSGFVPHMNYASDPEASSAFWGRRGGSTLTQPPMYGHALATLARRGHDVDALVEPAARALRWLWEWRRSPCGLLRIFHPWESGIDDHPRWQAWQPDPFERVGWRVTKGRLVEALELDDGAAVGSGAFDVCPASFNALAAWNARELATIAGDDRLGAMADEVADALEGRWLPARATWMDVSPAGVPGSDVRTLDALLPLLVTSDRDRATAALRSALDPTAYGWPYGPAGVHRDEPSFSPIMYGRGTTWPHLLYLLWAGARRLGLEPEAVALAQLLVAGAERSRLAEHWDPRDGHGLGARPQSWTGLAAVVSGPGPSH